MEEKVYQSSVEHAYQADQVEELKRTATVDTLHNDEGVKVLATYDGDQDWTDAEERKLVHKIDRRLLTILCCTYGLQYYDKAMLSQAVSRPVLSQAQNTIRTMLNVDCSKGALRPAYRLRPARR